MYKSFQAMCEPGTYSLLMGRVGAAERSGAAALNFLVLFCTQAVAAAASGAAISRFGYSVVLWAAAALAVVAGLLFRGLLEGVESARGVSLSEDRRLP
jgi:predicted MFS family arabinose efflux permease